MTRKTAKNLTGWEWRVENGVRQRRRSIKYDSGYITFTLNVLQAFQDAQGLDEPEWEIEKEWEYGEEYSFLRLKGWSAATDEEIKEEVAKLNDAQDAQDERDRKLAADLKARRPDLL